MAFRDDLVHGTLGLRLAIPDSLLAVHDAPQAIVLRDPERLVAWEISFHQLRVDLHPEHQRLLRRDLERDARALFESTHAEVAADTPAAPPTPLHTTDAAWSPIIEVTHLALGDAPALQILHRLTYQPGHELIAGRLLVPLATGTMEIGASHLTRTTGYREAMLQVMADSEATARDPLASAEPLTQARLDEPTYDILTPEHPLPLVRAALRWLVEPDGGNLTVVAPMPPSAPGEIELAAAASALTPPPRFLPLPAGALPTSPSLVTFSRVALSAADPHLFSVWRLPDERVSGPDPVKQLRRIARRTLASWASEGVSDLAIATSPLPELAGRAQAASHVRFTSAGRPRHAAARWFADADGAVFRVESSAPLRVPKQELHDEVDAAVQGWRRLGPLNAPLAAAKTSATSGAALQGNAPVASAPPKKWWKLW